MDENNKSNQTASVNAVVKLLASESNAHGVAKIATARSGKRRAFWSCLVILGFIAAMVQMAFLLMKYFAYPTVEISVKSRKLPVTFPDVTLCNTNPISISKVNELFERGDDMIQWFKFLEQTDFGQQESRLDSHQAFYENLPDASKHIGHSFSDTIVSCRFNNDDCGEQNFTLFFDGKDYYNCFTFTSSIEGNASKISSDKLQMNDPGPDNGLSLILSLNSQAAPIGAYGIYDMKNPTAFGGGIRAQIHRQNTLPTPAYHGFDVPPGYSTSIGLTTNVHTRLNSPYSECTEQTLEGQNEYFSTMFSCLQLCKQKVLINACGCMTSALPIFNSSDSSEQNFSFCGEIKNWKSTAAQNKKSSKLELDHLNCEQKVMENLRNNRNYESECGCSEPCNEISYEQRMSMSYWPEEFYQVSLLNRLHQNANTFSKPVREAFDTLNNTLNQYIDMAAQGVNMEYSDADLAKISRASTLIRKNFIRLNVYLQDLSVTEHIQMPAYDLVNLMADIGGTLILWMGISVLTLMEIFELFMALLFLVFNSDTYVMGDKRKPAKQGERQDIS